jgi:hypothetical protein
LGVREDGIFCDLNGSTSADQTMPPICASDGSFLVDSCKQGHPKGLRAAPIIHIGRDHIGSHVVRRATSLHSMIWPFVTKPPRPVREELPDFGHSPQTILTTLRTRISMNHPLPSRKHGIPNGQAMLFTSASDTCPLDLRALRSLSTANHPRGAPESGQR